MNILIKILILFFGLAGYIFGAVYHWQNGYDGPCSGVWGPYEFHCYWPSAFKSLLFFVIIPFVGSFFVDATLYMIGCLFAFLAVELFFLIGGGVSYHFQPNFYMPHIAGIWVGTYIFVASQFLFFLYWRKKYNKSFKPTALRAAA
jgi:hypothetical protein